ncbi:hypothetical protein EIP86_000601 [Pleurotus ostreatoroseus]|nr:hypothetical protein EIP86_000601 [Pleurotus ostreatoroseus]
MTQLSTIDPKANKRATDGEAKRNKGGEYSPPSGHDRVRVVLMCIAVLTGAAVDHGRDKGAASTTGEETDSNTEKSDSAADKPDDDGKKKSASTKGKEVAKKSKEPDSGSTTAPAPKEAGTDKPAASDAKDPKVSAGVKDSAKDIQNPGWIPDKVMERLAIAATKEKPSSGRYTLASVPADKVVWGGYMSTYMCYKGRILTVSFVARLVSTRFRNMDGTLPNCPSLKFKFLRSIDDVAARALVYDKGKPPRVTSKKTFWAGKRCSVIDPITKQWDAVAFADIFDGRTEVAKRGDMNRLSGDRLYSNDVVLLECQVTRFIQDQRRPVFTTARAWETRFRLVSVVKLYAPEDIEPEEESPDESEVREDSDDEEAF